MRVGVVALLQESNTFLAEPTTLAHFDQCEGEDVRTRTADAHHEVGGFFAGLAEEGIEAVPIFMARALPYGVVLAEAFDELVRRLLDALRRAGPLDGLLVAPHGATVAANHPDADGHWLTKVRELVGPTLPVIGTLDLHANLSPAMVAACDALIAYRSNPHLDQRDRGVEAARLMARTLRGEVRPVMAAAFPPLAVNIERQATAEPHWTPLFDAAATAGAMSVSYVHGFPYADVAEMGSAVIAVADGDRAAAQATADRLANLWWDRRHDFAGEFVSVEDAVTRAAALDGPVCLLDMGDNVGGGSPGDGTLIAHELLRRGVGPSFVCLHDPEAVERAFRSGMNHRGRLPVGGKTDDRHGPPLDAEAYILVTFSDGKFRETVARHGGITEFDQGPTAIVVVDDRLTVMLTSRRMVPFSLAQLTRFGVNPARFRVIVAKGVHAPVAAYAPVCKHLIRVDTPGVTSANLARLAYNHRRRPMFPFESETAWRAG